MLPVAAKSPFSIKEVAQGRGTARRIFPRSYGGAGIIGQRIQRAQVTGDIEILVLLRRDQQGSLGQRQFGGCLARQGR